MRAPEIAAAKLAPIMPDEAKCLNAAAAASAGRAVLNEAQSKALLALNKIMSPKESIATDADAAITAARSIGYPVVLKLLSDDIHHKSEVGGVMLGVANEAEVRVSFAKIKSNLQKANPAAHFGGVIVAQQIAGGQELVLGVHRDPEVGLVTMFGAGGILLELVKDVQFGPAPLNQHQARSMVEATMAGKLLAGYRGGAALDKEAVIKALVALSELAARLGDRLESIDVNPFVALPEGQGAVALDGLVVLRDAT
jgi:biotin carboxylase